MSGASKKKWALVAILVLVGTIVVPVVWYALNNVIFPPPGTTPTPHPSNSPTATPSPTQHPNATAVPTATPEPTQSPTATPHPTTSPSPTPVVHGPAFTYAQGKGLPSDIVQQIGQQMDSDGVMSDGEKTVIDAIAHVGNGLIPSDVMPYYNASEIHDLQSALYNSTMEDGKVGDPELQALGKLTNGTRWYVARDFIKAGMVKDGALAENWDNDTKDGKPLSNLEEIAQGTNPLDKLETDPNDLSNRFAVIAASHGYPDNPSYEFASVKRICEILKRNGYTNDTVYLVLDPGAGQVGMVQDLPIKPDFEVLYENGTQVPGMAAEEKAHFLNYIKNLPSDTNDRVIVYAAGHGNIDRIRIGDVVYIAELNDALSQMKYGECVNIINCSHSGGLIKNLGNLNPNPNMLLISGCSEDESADIPPTTFFEGLNAGLSVEQAFQKYSDWAKNPFGMGGNYHPQMLLRRAEPFYNPLVFKKQND